MSESNYLSDEEFCKLLFMPFEELTHEQQVKFNLKKLSLMSDEAITSIFDSVFNKKNDDEG